MSVERVQGSLDVLLGPVCGGLVVLHDAHTGEHPGTGGGQNLTVGPAHPLNHLKQWHHTFLSARNISQSGITGNKHFAEADGLRPSIRRSQGTGVAQYKRTDEGGVVTPPSKSSVLLMTILWLVPTSSLPTHSAHFSTVPIWPFIAASCIHILYKTKYPVYPCN